VLSLLSSMHLQFLRIIGLFVFLLSQFNGHAQLSIEGVVLDALSKEPVPYCAVGIFHKPAIACLSNEEGAFRLTGHAPTDTLLLSCVGYKTKLLPLARLNTTVLLERSVVSLKEVVVLGDDAFLYHLFEACRKQLAQSPEQSSKAYYVLESTIAGQPVELLECYYKAQTNNAVLKGLEFKNGRVGVAPVDGRYFVNLNGSKAFTFLNLSNTNTLLPGLPTQLTGKKLKKQYRLRLKNIVPQADSLYNIEFVPRDTSGAFFSGELWIEKRSGQLKKIILHSETATHHPFMPVFAETGRIAGVSMQVTKTYATQRGVNTISHINFDYTIHYTHRHSNTLLNENADTTFDVHSKGLIYFYDFGKPFIPPYFQYNPELNDYRKIASLSYNDAFWSSNTGLIYSKNMQRGIAYFRKYGSLLNYRKSHRTKAFGKGWMFENSYIPWSDTVRVGLRKDIQKDTASPASTGGQAFRADQYRLRAQLFLDLNPVGDSVQHYSMAVFDTDQTFYHLPEEPVTNCFINIYFDLFEIERRHLETLIGNGAQTVARLDTLYKASQKRIEAQSADYLREVERGRNYKALDKWNAFVMNELQIDNIALFGVRKPE